MGLMDRIFGREPEQPTAPPVPPAPHRADAYGTAQPQRQPRSDDEIAIERYRYLLRTAPPETIEQVHAEAFAKLTPEQRQQVFRELSEQAPEGEKPRSDSPEALAQSATRSELRQPGTMERTFAGRGGAGGGGMGFGGMMASSLLGTVAGYVIGSALVGAFLPDPGADQASGEGDTGGEGDGGGDASGDGGGDPGADAGGDPGADAGADAGGGWGDGGFGDFGGGDFGGGDFGGGDFGGF